MATKPKTIAKQAGKRPRLGDDPSSDSQGLSIREKRFVDAYVNEACGSGVEAALIAGYSTNRVSASTYASTLLSKPKIQKHLKQVYDVHGMSTAATIQRLTQTVQASIGDFITIDDDHPNGKIDLRKAKANGKLHLIEEITWTDQGPRIKLGKRTEALALLAKIQGLLIDRVDVQVRADPIQLQNELMAKLADAAQKLDAADRARLQSLPGGSDQAVLSPPPRYAGKDIEV